MTKKDNIKSSRKCFNKKYEIYLCKENILLKILMKKKGKLFYYKKTNSEIIDLIHDFFLI